MGEVEAWVFRRVLIALTLLWTVVQLSASCPLHCVCQNSTDANITNITSVICAQGNLTAVPKDLPQELSSLNLSGNRIVLLGESSLADVNLQQSLNTSVFDNLYNLKILDLSQNAISTIQPHVFEALGLVKELNLSSNNLTDLYSDMLSGLTAVDKLNLGSNNIASIENNTFLYLEQLRSWISATMTCQSYSLSPSLACKLLRSFTFSTTRLHTSRLAPSCLSAVFRYLT
ncbi:leucine-rich repeat and transmembrane domain-containing protein 1-like [Haliotis rubra]|uniref:leucine-rich repeat and transmembrane domain-containing protein 1-like n=1 Tax=Haliotis rubra TaxID=36100 RepID=UPI001EE53225|nr:leucine-rich repeat and transmembrane domain-containing protein 1-like [Haliotis rubra]XP_046585069.1 leucine-rich repeat and transmembrane domain-containing protein 1-like [Haliotis rubra]